MTLRIAHNPFSKPCVSFHIKLFFSLVFVYFICVPAITVFPADQSKKEEVTSQTQIEPVYLIPDQSDAFLQFGVAITPDKGNYSIENKHYSRICSPPGEANKIEQSADVSTVVRIALDEFDCISGLNHWVDNVEKTMNGYTRKLMLTGELKLDSYKKDPVNYIEKVNIVAEVYKDKAETPVSHYLSRKEQILNQFEINQVTWNLGFSLSSPELSFKVGIGKAFTVQSSVGEDIKIGAMIKLAI